MKNNWIICFFFLLAFATSAQENSLPVNGNVGIGTLNPSARLDVNGHAIVDSSLTVKDSLVVNKNAHIVQKMIVDQKVTMKDNAVVQQNFRVMGNTRLAGNVKLSALPTAVNPANKQFILSNPNGKLFKSSSNASDFLSSLVYSKYCSPLQSGDVPNPVWNNGLNKIFSPCPQVFVGIGTDTPLHSLDVRGAMNVSQNAGFGSIPHPSVQVNAYTTREVGFCIDHNYPASFGYAFKALVRSETTKGLGIHNLSYGKEVFTIYGNGKIEVSNATQKIFQLETNGLLRARKIKVDASAWADYVFTNDYRLRTIQEVNSYINTHKKLPGIPSEQTVLREGIDVADFDRLILEKIEELTLYIIQLDERTSRLETTLNSNR